MARLALRHAARHNAHTSNARRLTAADLWAPIDATTAFAGLYAGWIGSAGKTIVGPDVTAWASTVGSIGAPVSLETDGLNTLPGSTANAVRYTTIAPESDVLTKTTAGMLASANSDGHVLACFKPISSSGIGYFEVDFDDGAGGYQFIYWSDGVAYVGVTDGAGTSTNLAVVSSPVGSTVCADFWSDAVNLNARVNGGTVYSIPWVTTRWGGPFATVQPYSSEDIVVDLHELHIVRGAYEGHDAAGGWRSYCAQQYGYMGG